MFADKMTGTMTGIRVVVTGDRNTVAFNEPITRTFS